MCSGAPASRNTSSGRPSTSALPAASIGNGWPVRAWRRLAQRASSQAPTAPAKSAAAIQTCVGCACTATGSAMPRLLRNTAGSGESAWRGPGRLSEMTVYQKKSCTSSGTLRSVST